METLKETAQDAGEAKDWDKAIETWTELVKAQPENAYFHRQLAVSFYERGDYPNAVNHMQEVVALEERNSHHLTGLCWYQILDKQLENARRACERALALDPTNWAAMANLGHTWLLLGQPTKAAPYYQSTLEYIQDRADWESSPLADFDLFIKKGWEVEASSSARQWFVHEAPKYMVPLTLRDEAVALYRSADYEASISKINIALAQQESVLGTDHSNVAMSLNILALLLDTTGRYSEADPSYRRALAIQEQALGPDHPKVATSVNNLAGLLYKTGRYSEAEPLFRRALAVNEQALGPEHPYVANSLNNLAFLLDNIGRQSEAEPLYRRALAIREHALGPEHPDVATSLNTLAEMLRNTGRHFEAEPLFRRALAIDEHALGPGHPDVAISLDGLANLLETFGRYAEAEPLYQRSLVIWEKALGSDHPALATGLNNLAMLLGVTGRYAEAELLCRRALKISERALGPEHSDVATSLDSLATLLGATGRYAEAEPLQRRALAIWEKALGREHPNLASGLNSLGKLLRQTGRYAEAEPLYRRALAIWAQSLGPEHPDMAISLNGLAELFYITGRYAEAEPLYRRALAIREYALQPEHGAVAASLNNLALLLRATSRYTEAESLSRQALKIWEKALGSEHPDVATGLNNLALLLRTTGRYSEAEPLYRRALAINERALGPQHPDVANNLCNLALLLNTTGRYVEAEHLYRQALTIREQALGPEHPDVATDLNNLAVLSGAAGRYAEAEPLLRHALAIREKALGPGHPDVAMGFNNLAVLLNNTGRNAEADTLFRSALAIQEQALGPQHPDVANSLNNLASLLTDTGLHAEAEPLFLRSYQIYSIAGEPLGLATSQSNLMVFYKSDNPRLAIFYGKQAVNTLQTLRSGLASAEQETQQAFTQTVEGTYNTLANLLIDQVRLPEAEQVLAMLKEQEYFEFVRRDANADARKTLTSLTRAEAPWAERYAEISPRLAALGRRRAELRLINEQVRSAEENAELVQLDQDLQTAHDEMQVFFSELKAAFSALPADQAVAFSDQDIKALRVLRGTIIDLGHDAVVVHYLVTPEQVRILLTTPDVQLHRDSPIAEKELNKLIADYRAVLQNPRLDPLPLAQKLYQVLIQPIQADLDQAGAKTVMLSLYGNLRYLPFNALHDGQRWLTERYAVALYTSVAQGNLKDKPRAQWSVAGLGVSEGVTVDGRSFSPLPAVPLELASIIQEKVGSGVLPGVRYLDTQFNTQALLGAIQRDYSVLHLATHFHFAANDADSFLLLGNGQKLTLADFKNGENYFMENVELLTLSACETALGTVGADGREVEGLAVVAQQQNAKAVLATLWSVADASTGIFMRTLYESRQQKQLTKAAAVQQAQWAFIDGTATAAGIPEALRGATRKEATASAGSYQYDPNKPFAHPYYWAPFVLMGNWL